MKVRFEMARGQDRDNVVLAFINAGFLVRVEEETNMVYETSYFVEVEGDIEEVKE